MSFAERLLSRPHAILAATIAFMLLGIIGFFSIPTNLFPDTNRPSVSVVVQWPGAMTTDMANEVTHPLEVRLSSIDGVRRVTSTSRDEVSAVQVEFEYGNDINTAANEVTTELSRVRGQLPTGIHEPLVFKITDAAHAAMVLAVRPGKGSGLDMAQVRRMAENQLRDVLMNLPGVADAEVFGGPVRQVAVDLDRNRLQAHQLAIVQVMAALTGSNVSQPAGMVYQRGDRYLLTAQALSATPEDIAAILVPLNNGSYVRVGDLGTVDWGEADPTSLYHGNGSPAVAVSLLRSEKGFTKPVIDAVDAHLANVQAQFPNLDIRIADTQGRIIGLTVSNMLDSLRDAVIMTLIVILLFLGNSRAALVVALSLPLSYLLTFAILWWIGFEFNMVTLSAIIIAVGLLADDVVVVMENIERRMREMGEHGKLAATRGLDEILMADTSGTVSTILVLLPIMFIGGFVETVLRPLTITLSVALFASLVVSVSIIPLFAPMILKPGARDPLAWLLNPFTRYVMEPMKRGYVRLVDWGLDHRMLILILFLSLFVASASQLRFQGRELMPLMDTGISQIRFEAAPDTDDQRMGMLLTQVEAAIKSELSPGWLISISSVIGAEPGVKSFGAARLLQQGEVTLNIVDRFHRDRTLEDINHAIQQRLHRIPGLISANVSAFGATPLSSIRASVDVMLKGPDPAVLGRLADEVMQRLKSVHGLTGIERTWQNRSQRIALHVDPAKARLYGLTAGDVAAQVAVAVGGAPAGTMRVPGENSIPVRVRLQKDQRTDLESVRAINIRTKNGQFIPLASLAEPGIVSAPTAQTHQYLQPTIDILGWRQNVAITALHDEVMGALADIELPHGYSMNDEGEYKQLAESAQRLVKAITLGMILLYLMLVVTFRSFLDPVAIMACLPLAVIGAAFGIILGGKFLSMPGQMGLILLMGIVVNNGILLVDFAKQAMREGMDLRQAVLESV
ncbi:MAG: efflux RND transporter permease subunit, partial [Mariprofundaceae bacterium]|nr:efflux RND transporter permease subunit [Mariprofundaceae bacterium]